jgi:C-methyltransferase
MAMIQGAQAAAVIRAGLEVGVFEALAAGRDTAERVASGTGADVRGTRILLDALAALGLLVRHDGRWALSKVADAHLVEGRPAYLGGTARLFASDHLAHAWTTLPQAVRCGGTVLEEHAETPDHPFWSDFARWTGGMAGQAGQRLAELLAPWAAARRPLEVLDVACGTGLYGFSVAASQPHARVTSLDWPNVLEVTRTWAERAGVAERVRWLPGDCFTTPLGGPYDLVIMSHIFHHFAPEACEQLLARVGAATKPGGKVAIHEFVPTGAPHEDPAPYLFSTTMLVWTRTGEAHDLERYRELLAAAGFGPPEVHPSGGLPTRFLLAGKR